MQVLKFGGSSVANAANIRKVISVVEKAGLKNRTIVIVSALGGITDTLIQCAEKAATGDESFRNQVKNLEQRHLEAVKELIPVNNQSSVLSLVMKHCNEIEDLCNGVFLLQELSARIKDRIVSYGEILSSKIISAALQAVGVANTWKDARELLITDSNFGNAGLNFKLTDANIQNYFSSSRDQLFVIPGFIAANKQGITTTLGRGGSDYSASIFAAALDAAVLEIWTDVSGIMTADPRFVTNARVIGHISYQEAMELSHFGAKVIYPPTLQPVLKSGVPVWVKNTFSPDDEGTRVDHSAVSDHHAVRGISSINSIALLGLEGSGMVGIPGFSKRLFESLAAEHINVIMITQASSEHSISVGVEENNALRAKEAIDRTFQQEISSGAVDPLVVETGLAVVALVGDHMKSHPGISGKMFGALGRNGINVRAIAQGSSERNITSVIASRDVKKALNVLHEEFFETTYKQINVFITGAGNVGSKLLSQLHQQARYLLDNLRLQVRVIGIANSRKMAFNEEGLDTGNWKQALENGADMDLEAYVENIRNKNLRNSVFVDVTANEKVAMSYSKLLEKSISVVACNKIACSSSYEYYRKLKDLAREYNCQFLFETNVGAGLPVIGTLNDLLRSGDRVNRIEAVLSGTLNFVFNNYNGERSFAEVVRQAQEEGYTEPDPRLDLGGTDVMRKIMILARESGESISMEDISNESFMPADCMKGSVEDFYREMELHETHFRRLYDNAVANGAKLKFVARFENGKAEVGLKEIPPQSDFYHLYGKDNVVLFYTERYPSQPLVVKGAGAGADVTASGVFSDLIRAGRI